MYIGRFVVAGRMDGGQLYVGYRVSGRSQPNRRIVFDEGVGSVLPKEGFSYDNPFVSYRCFTRAGSCIVASNGSHTMPIAEKIMAGLPIKDSVALPLLALDFEHDHLNTPRVAAVADHKSDKVWFGIVSDSKIEIREVPLNEGEAYLLAVYEAVEVTPVQFSKGRFSEPSELSQALIDLEYEHAICSIGGWISGGKLMYGISQSN